LYFLGNFLNRALYQVMLFSIGWILWVRFSMI